MGSGVTGRGLGSGHSTSVPGLAWNSRQIELAHRHLPRSTPPIAEYALNGSDAPTADIDTRLRTGHSKCSHDRAKGALRPSGERNAAGFQAPRNSLPVSAFLRSEFPLAVPTVDGTPSTGRSALSQSRSFFSRYASFAAEDVFEPSAQLRHAGGTNEIRFGGGDSGVSGIGICRIQRCAGT